MRRIISTTAVWVLALVTSWTQPAVAQDGAVLFEQYCAACHMGEARGPDRVAPPIFAVKNHYTQVHQRKDDFVQAVANWVRSPDSTKSLMPGATRRFGLMAPVAIEPEAAVAVAEFVYSGKFDVPGWYAEHYRLEHGKDPAIEPKSQ